jgi:hypothetical protein
MRFCAISAFIAETCGVEQIAGDGLGVRDGPAGEGRADARDLATERAQARVEAGKAGAVCGRVRGVCALELLRDRSGDPPECRYVVPEVRVRIAAMNAEHIGDREHHALRARRGVLELRHECVVADAVLDHDARRRDREPVARARLEEVGVGIRIGEDRRDMHVRAADLLSDVAVHVLGRDDCELGGLAPAAAAHEESGASYRTNDNGSHSHSRVE